MNFRVMSPETGGEGTSGTGGTGTTGAPAEFKAEEAVAFLTEHGVDAKSLEGVAEADLKSRFEGAQSIAAKAAEKALAAVKTAAPEKYEFAATEGVTPDAEVVKEFEAFAREAGLPQDKAQKGYALGAKIAQGVIKQQQAQVAALTTQWASEAKADKEYGGEKFDENMKFVAAAREKAFSPGLREVLDKSGLGNHPELVRLAFRVGKLVSEDKHVEGSAPKTMATIADRLYGGSSNK